MSLWVSTETAQARPRKFSGGPVILFQAQSSSLDTVLRRELCAFRDCPTSGGRGVVEEHEQHGTPASDMVIAGAYDALERTDQAVDV